jgi:putative tributyrin esterase
VNFGPIRLAAICLSGALLLPVGCRKTTERAKTDSPRLTKGVALQDVTFHSAALQRDMPYRVILPVHIGAGDRLPVLYLLHGGGGGFSDWSNYSDVARFAEGGLLLVMPEGKSSYFANAAERSEDRYEDYIVKDLVADVESRFPAATGRANRAIAGVSMGGFAAVNLAFRHPELFVFAGGLSAALDVPSRPFSVKRLEQWRRHRAIFGPWGGQTQRDNDPLVLVRSADPAKTPYLFLTCGEQEGLLTANRSLASWLGQRGFQYEFHTVSGGHDWNQWNGRLAYLFQSLQQHVGRVADAF